MTENPTGISASLSWGFEKLQKSLLRNHNFIPEELNRRYTCTATSNSCEQRRGQHAVTVSHVYHCKGRRLVVRQCGE